MAENIEKIIDFYKILLDYRRRSNTVSKSDQTDYRSTFQERVRIQAEAVLALHGMHNFVSFSEQFIMIASTFWSRG